MAAHDHEWNHRDRVLFGVTAANTALTFLSGQLSHLRSAGWDSHLLSPDTPGQDVAQMAQREGATLHVVEIARRPSTTQDVRSLISVARTVWRVRPRVVVAGTPKMSLLLLVASWVLRVPHRVYLCHGLRFEGFDAGWRRRALTAMERLLVRLSTRAVAVSASVRTALLQIGVADGKVVVLGPGSPNGVDLERFKKPTAEDCTNTRLSYELSPASPVAAFVGRLTHDKGIATLLRCARDMPEVQFLVAGSEEPADPADREIITQLRRQPNVRLLGRVSDIERVYRATDLLLLPTRREGMPTVVLEAAATGRPTVAYAATGTVDAVIDGRTGVLIEQGDDSAFSETVGSLLYDAQRRNQLATAAENWATTVFAPTRIWDEWATFLAALRQNSSTAGSQSH